MLSFRLPLLLALVALTVASVMNWRAQIQTQQKLDAINTALADRSPAPNSTTPPISTPQPTPPAQPTNAVPRELSRISLPPYVIEAPDQLLIEAVVRDPKTGTTDRLPNQPISGQFLVRPDGSVGLGLWGSVSVTGLTLEQASKAVREQIAKNQPQGLNVENVNVIVDVLAYNSKRYYVITNGDSGEQVLSFPLTGNETVLDAIANIAGLPEVASKSPIRVVRKSDKNATNEILPVEWRAITEHGITTTNYQLHPGDRVYVTRNAR